MRVGYVFCVFDILQVKNIPVSSTSWVGLSTLPLFLSLCCSTVIRNGSPATRGVEEDTLFLPAVSSVGVPARWSVLPMNRDSMDR